MALTARPGSPRPGCAGGQLSYQYWDQQQYQTHDLTLLRQSSNWTGPVSEPDTALVGPKARPFCSRLDSKALERDLLGAPAGLVFDGDRYAGSGRLKPSQQLALLGHDRAPSPGR